MRRAADLTCPGACLRADLWDTRDPARFAFAHGGKDGTPFPVDRMTYERTITILHQALNRAKVERSEKVQAFKRLANLQEGGSRPYGSAFIIRWARRFCQ